MKRTLPERDAWLLLGALTALVLVSAPQLGSEPWRFRPGAVHPHGALAFVARAAHERWDLGLMRSVAVLAGVLVLVAAAAALAGRLPRRRTATALAAAVVLALVVPAVVLQVALREATAPWFYVNDSTYEIELAGQLVLHGHNPYGHDYSHSGLERFYSLDGTPPAANAAPPVALHHFAYFPGTALAAAAWSILPSPFDDFRFLVALATLALLPAALAFRGPFGARLALGAALAANPLAVRAAWFGTADALCVLLIVLAFAFLTRSRYAAGAAVLGGAVLTKQFAVVALPFYAAMLLVRHAPLRRPAAACFGVIAVGVLPFLAADPGAFWRDTISYGGSTYRIIGYGLAALLLRAHVLASRTGSYPFLPLVALVWLPVTAWLVRVQLRRRALWVGGVGFAISIFLLLFLARVFQTSYLVYPLAGAALACLLAGADVDDRARVMPADGDREHVPAGSGGRP
ncbi:MAG: hypothetical protein QOE91_1570 [Gaiellaceae bacterium]|nr:hypothetical protein [Gaiellaceae bacterium]